MALNPHGLKPLELLRLMNSTPLEATLSRDRFFQQRARAGLAIGDGQTIDLIRYAAWMFLEWRERRARGEMEDGNGA